MSRRNTELLLLCLAAPFVVLLFAMVLVQQGTALSLESLTAPLGLFAAFVVAHIATRFLAKNAGSGHFAHHIRPFRHRHRIRHAPRARFGGKPDHLAVRGHRVHGDHSGGRAQHRPPLAIQIYVHGAGHHFAALPHDSRPRPGNPRQPHLAEAWSFQLPARRNRENLHRHLLGIVFGAKPRDALHFHRARWPLPRSRPGRRFAPLLVMWAISFIIVVFEKDLGSALVCFVLFLVMLYIASGKKLYLVVGFGLAAIGCVFLYQFFGHVQIRVNTWLDPFSDASGNGYQLCQTLYSLADGGMVGVGIGNGLAENIPVVESDFIFAAIAEETGLLGGAAVLLSYLSLCIGEVSRPRLARKATCRP